MKTGIKITKNGRTVLCPADEEETILSVLRRADIFIPAFCGGHGLCGKCKVTALGALSEPSDEEKSLLTEDELARGIRLACAAKIVGEAEALVPSDGAYSVMTDIGGDTADYFPSCREGLGAAVDLGTTTVAVYVYSLETRRRVGVISDVNRQQALGADVISRIEYCLSHEGGSKTAKELIVGQLNDMIKSFCKKRSVSEKKIKSVTIAGNTAMLYLLTGRTPKALAAAPFEADELFGSFFRGADVGLALPEANVFLLPCISAFVGGDITAGILSSKLYEASKNTLFIDFGTNGEMALSSGGKIVCCSTAAGPAFEGAKISCGVGGVEGAINKVSLDGDRLAVSTIGGKKPIGLAGSGLVDASACLLKIGKIDESGRLEEPFEIAEGVTLLPRDIREFQLAKAAVRAGAETLLESTGITARELDAVLLTGGFGAGLNIENGISLGLLPDVPPTRVKALGNCAGAGAVRALLDPTSITEFQRMRERAATIRLDGDAGFTDKFSKYMWFTKQGV